MNQNEDKIDWGFLLFVFTMGMVSGLVLAQLMIDKGWAK